MFVRERDCLISEADRVYIETLMICLHCLRAHTVADCVLGFNTEEEAWREAMDVIDTRVPTALRLISGQVRLLKVP